MPGILCLKQGMLVNDEIGCLLATVKDALLWQHWGLQNRKGSLRAKTNAQAVWGGNLGWGSYIRIILLEVDNPKIY